MSGAATVVLGISIPSTDPSFLSLVAVHVAFGPPAIVAGLIAMVSPKGSRQHVNAGTIYFWSLAGLSATMAGLSYLRWREDYHLCVLGVSAFTAVLLGRHAIRHRWPRIHLASMASSYVLMLTAFYVDNGPNLPVWRDLPHKAYWIVPTAIGLPITIFYLFRPPRFAYARERGEKTV